MSDEFRTSYDSGYVAAIGRAIYIFVIYEWNVVHTTEKLRPGFLHKWRFAKNAMTAGTVGKKFSNAVGESSHLARPLTLKLKEAALPFMEFVDERNELVHAQVYSEPDGRQQLIYLGRDKTRTRTRSRLGFGRLRRSTILLIDSRTIRSPFVIS